MREAPAEREPGAGVLGHRSLPATPQPRWKDPGCAGRGGCGGVGWRPLGLVFDSGGKRAAWRKQEGIEGVASRPLPEVAEASRQPEGRSRLPGAHAAVGEQGQQPPRRNLPPASGYRRPDLGKRSGRCAAPLSAPAAWLAAYFPSWQASRCRQGNACGELFILLKFEVGQRDVGGERQAAAGTILFRSPSTCVV